MVDSIKIRNDSAARMRTRVGGLVGFLPDGRFMDNEGRLWAFEHLVSETEALYDMTPQNDFYPNLLRVARFLWTDNPDGEVCWWCRTDKEAMRVKNRIRKWTSRAKKKAFAQGSVAPVIWTELVSMTATNRSRVMANGETEPYVPCLVLVRRVLGNLEDDPDWHSQVEDGLKPRPVGRPRLTPKEEPRDDE